MAFLVVGGVTVEVVSDGAAEREPFTVGESVRAFDGSLRSTVRAEKREWQFETYDLSPVQFATLRAAIGPSGSLVTCSGDALGAALLCEVTITAAPYIRDGVGFVRTVSLRLREA